MSEKKIKKGFTLIEMIVAVGIFAIMSIAITSAFASGLYSFNNTRQLQRNLETAQFAMNMLAKQLRTSTIHLAVENGKRPQISFLDHSSGKCYHYRFNNLDLPSQAWWSSQTEYTLQMRNKLIGGGSFDDACNPNDETDWTTSTWYTVVPYYVYGDFEVTISDNETEDIDPDNTREIGRATIHMIVKKNATSSNEAHVQTSVSLRDYAEVGL